MDPQVRNFRDFLLLYNKLTEMCFQHCTDNFFNRSLSSDETQCVDKCVLKFSNVNQKIMKIYVEAQTEINQRRAIEMEEQLKLVESTQNQNKEVPSSVVQTMDSNGTENLPNPSVASVT